MSKRKICVVTGTRAEYGLLYWLMKEIKEDPDLVLQIIATGMHLSPEFGLTYRMIEQDGFHIDEKVEMLLSSDTPVAIAKSMGLATIGFADAFERLKPDIVVVLGDRYEILAAAQAAMVARIPIAHISGGETTEGVIDESIRHSITKMAHIHFVSAEPYRKRVIQLGENPDRVFNVGDPAFDIIRGTKLLNREEFEHSIGLKLGEINFLVTYHPVTLKKESSEYVIQQLFGALDRFPNAHVIFTQGNSDTGGRIINKLINEYVQKHEHRMTFYTSLGQLRYLSAIQHVDVVLGNSSSGIVEVPVFKKPTVNIGDRQKGRLRASSIIDCSEDTLSIVSAIEKALSAEFQNSLQKVISPYDCGECSKQMKAILKTIDLNGLVVKKFFDLEVGE